MMKEVRVKCPECKKVYIVDVRTGQIIREHRKVEESEDLFKGALEKVKGQKEGAEDRFSQAMKSEEGRQSRLEEAFDEAKKRARDNPDEKPINPMDLD